MDCLVGRGRDESEGRKRLRRKVFELEPLPLPAKATAGISIMLPLYSGQLVDRLAMHFPKFPYMLCKSMLIPIINTAVQPQPGYKYDCNPHPSHSTGSVRSLVISSYTHPKEPVLTTVCPSAPGQSVHISINPPELKRYPPTKPNPPLTVFP